ncbi:hypothetical protein CQY21_26765 [Mycolicibacterium boenickei]|nr:hypothetical protein CQY21_26765 [Mycolicibacterium boenickei]
MTAFGVATPAGGSTAAGGAGAGVAVALGVGVSVVTVSGDRGAVGAARGGTGFDVASWAGCVVCVGCADGEVRVADTDPLSPPPRITTVQMTAISRIAPATAATQIQRRSMGSS